jgi:phage tail sheath protein FI
VSPPINGVATSITAFIGSTRENGIVNIVIGFAPMHPAEFVMLTIQQTALVS